MNWIKRLKILFLKWQIKILLKKYHLARNPIGSGRRKKVEVVNMEEVQRIVEGMGHESPLGEGGKEVINEQKP